MNCLYLYSFLVEDASLFDQKTSRCYVLWISFRLGATSFLCTSVGALRFLLSVLLCLVKKFLVSVNLGRFLFG